MRLSHYKTAVIVTALCASAGFIAGTHIGKSVRHNLESSTEDQPSVELSAPLAPPRHAIDSAETALKFLSPLPAFYTNIQTADLARGNAILVNKFNELPADFAPDDLVMINSTQSLTAEAAAHYFELIAAAEAAGFNLVVTSGFRTYNTQSGLYQSYIARGGFDYAETWSARPGFSEHQTGLAMDIVAVGTNFDTFGGTPACIWLAENAHQFGFILRYPEGQENITGFSYEPWHYRYLGPDLATRVKNTGLTYDQYYAAFLAE